MIIVWNNNSGAYSALDLPPTITYASPFAPATPPSPPVISLDSQSVVNNISWTAVAGATAYTLYRDGIQIYSGALTSFSDTTTGSHTYYVTVTTSSGTSPASNVIVASGIGGGGGNSNINVGLFFV